MNYKLFSSLRNSYNIISKRLINYYISTPIFYANARPHIGHIHTLFVADALNIFQRLKTGNNDTIFSTGSDEHGIKIQNAAIAANLPYKKFCDINSASFKNLFDKYETTYTDFIRTTDQKHIDAVQRVWRDLDDAGYIYKSTYSGWYCTTDEVFVPESSVETKEVDGKVVHVDPNGNELVWSSEENYMFRMDLVKEKILQWLRDEKPVIPKMFNDLAITMTSEIQDISISRPRERLNWGIQVPSDPSQTIYVWLDALTNYLTVVGYPATDGTSLRRWPIDCQVLGKDIVRFHAVYWPAFLSGLSLSLPKRLICHSHWLVESLKMSKSRGNVVDPLQESTKLTQDGLRYYLLRSSTPHSDNNYSHLQAIRRVNSELADTFGNLLSRCCAPSVNPRQVIPRTLINANDARQKEILDGLARLSLECAAHYEEANFYRSVDLVMDVVRKNNALYQECAPWKLIKQDDLEARILYNDIQTISLETLRVCSIILLPIVPRLAGKVLKWFNYDEATWSDARVQIGTKADRIDDRIGVNSDDWCNSSEIILNKRPKEVFFCRLKE